MAVCCKPDAILVPNAFGVGHPIVGPVLGYKLQEIRIGLHRLQLAGTLGQAQKVTPSRIWQAIAPPDIVGKALAHSWCIGDGNASSANGLR